MDDKVKGKISDSKPMRKQDLYQLFLFTLLTNKIIYGKRLSKMKIKLPQLKCLRCGKVWIPRKIDVRMCPYCKSPWWDTKREKRNKI